MVGILQPLSKQFKIADEMGLPTDYFIRWAQQRQVDIGESVSEERARAIFNEALSDINVIAGFGLSGGGDLSNDVTLNLDASIDDLTDVDTSTTPPTAGQALLWSGSKWEPGTVSGGGGSAWWYNPPTVSSMTTYGTGGPLALSNDPDEGLLVTIPAAGGNLWATQNLPATGSWTAIMRLAKSGGNADVRVGLGALSSTTQRMVAVSFAFEWDYNELFRGTAYGGTITAINSNSLQVGNRPTSDFPWYKIRYDSVTNTYTFWWSANGKQWLTAVGTNSVTGTTAFTGSLRPDKVGVWSRSGSSGRDYFAQVGNFQILPTATG